VATSAEQLGDRDKRGRFVAGNKTATRARGTPKRPKPLNIHRKAVEMARERVEALMPRMVELLEEAAEAGNVVAIEALMKRAMAGATSQTKITGAEHLVGLDPETRVRRINELVTAGQLSLENGRQLAELARQESDAELLQPLRRLIVELRTMTPERALARLAAATDTLSVLDSDQQSEGRTPQAIETQTETPEPG
jgi:hypothetical protein